MLLSNSTWFEDIEAITEAVDPSVAKMCTLLLALAIVIGVLLIIPTIIQNVSMYVWDVQIKQEHNILAAAYEAEEKCLFIYRVVCYIGAFIVLCFSSLPTLMMIIARKGVITSSMVRQRLYSWGWCQFFVYADLATRSFVTFMVVIPVTEFFVLYWIHVWWRGEMRVKKLFVYIASTIPIILVFCLLSHAILIPFVFEKITASGEEGNPILCNGGKLFTFYYYYEYSILHFVPCIILLIIIPVLLRNLEEKEYGILYEPTVYLCTSLPLAVTQTIFEIFQSTGYGESIISSTPYANALIITLTIYHMNFSAIFLVFTIKNVVQEIREERALKRRRSTKKWNRQNSSKAVVRRSLQRQYSVVMRTPNKDDLSATDKELVTKKPTNNTEVEAMENYNVLFNAAHAEIS